MIGSTLQHYHVRSRLGAGGMGEVYLAEDTRLGRDVALKVLPQSAQADPDRRSRFLTEARAVSSLSSSHIAALYDIGEQDGAIYLVMEYVEGEPLTELIKRGPLSVRQSVDIAMQVADALGEAHARGIVHRDIKSANVMLTSRGQAKVLDFGLAKFLDAGERRVPLEMAVTFERTVAGLVLGTVSYMSPEQALGRPVDGRSDLFSLGVVLYEMLAGRLPFPGETFGAVIDAILHQTPPPIARPSESVPPRLEAVVRRALDKRLDARYQAARELLADLEAIRVDMEEDERHRSSSSGRVPRLIAAASPPAAENSIAVITFTNITREPADEWIGSGIAETVGADLKNVPGVTVIGRERIFDALRTLQSSESATADDRFAIEIGRGLAARWIIAGGYQRFGDQLRITARFVEVSTGAVLRNVKIDGPIGDIFGLQDRIVFELTQGLNLQLGGAQIAEIQKPETRSVEAYELYSRATMTLRVASRDAPDRAISLFEKALELDPEYAEAWAGLGGALQLKGVFLSLPELLEKALEHEARALAIDPGLADAHTWRGGALLGLGRVDEAIEALQQAIKLDPRQVRSWAALGRAYWVGRGDVAQGVAAIEHALEINPQFGYGHLQLAFLYAETGDFTRAEQAARRAVDLQERYISGEEGLIIVGAHTRLGYVYYRQGRYGEAVEQYQKELLFLTATDHVLKPRALIELHQKLGAAYHRLGQPADAERHLKVAIRSFEERVASGADDPQTAYYAAIAYALAGKPEKAVKYLAKTVTKLGGALNRQRMAGDPDLEDVRPLLKDKQLIP